MTSRTSSVERGRRGAAGFTLVELLVVCALVAMLMGISVGALSRIGEAGALDASHRLVRATLLRARTTARKEQAGARVTVYPADAAQGVPAALGLSLTRLAGSWHFDRLEGGRVPGGANNAAVLRSASLVEGGTVRSAVLFEGSGQVVCDASALYDPERGFVLALDVWPDPEGDGGPLASFGDVFHLELTPEGGLRATVAFGEQGEGVPVETAPGRLARGRWARVELRFDGLEILLRAHGVVEARKPERRRLLRPEGDDRLIFGGKGFKGRLDEIVYLTEAFEVVEELPPSIEIPLPAPLSVRFDPDGRLDERAHDARVVVPVALEDERRTVQVDLSGVVR